MKLFTSPFKLAALAGFLLCSTTHAEVFFQQTTPTLNSGESVTYEINIPASTTPGVVKYGAEIIVDGTLGYVGIDRDPGVSAGDSDQQFSTATERVLIGDGLANGTYYVTVANVAPLISNSFTISGEIRNISLVQHNAKVLGGPGNHHIVSHGRGGVPESYAVLSNLILKKDPTAAVFRVDWRDGANANYPEKTGLQGSRFIKPAGAIIAGMLTNASVDKSRVGVWGHSWGSYIVQETSENLGGAKSLVALDPAETTIASRAVGNVYREANFGAAAFRSLALVADRGLYGGESEANTARISVLLDIRDEDGDERKGATNFLQGGGEDSALHNLPVRCMEYSLRKFQKDKISKQIVDAAFGLNGKLKPVDKKGPDWELVSSTKKLKYLEHVSLKKDD